MITFTMCLYNYYNNCLRLRLQHVSKGISNLCAPTYARTSRTELLSPAPVVVLQKKCPSSFFLNCTSDNVHDFAKKCPSFFFLNCTSDNVHGSRLDVLSLEKLDLAKKLSFPCCQFWPSGISSQMKSLDQFHFLTCPGNRISRVHSWKLRRLKM